MHTRREVLAGAGSLGLWSAACRPVVAQDLGRDRLVLLGTKGGPSLRGLSQFPSASLLVVAGLPFVIDTGYGTVARLVAAKIPLPTVRHVFITHLHSDHVIELGSVFYNAWANGLKAAADAYGPHGIKAVLSGYWESMRFDIETRVADEGRPDLRKLVTAHEHGEGAVALIGGVKVAALRNVHPPITESFALKFEFDGKIVVFSGDTAYFPPLADFARNADYLVHEVMYGPAMEALVHRNPNAAKLFEHLKASHTLVDDVGLIAAQANVKNLVLNHFVPADDPAITEADWTAGVRKHFSGNVIVGRDLMEIPLG
ncbi:MBL fold metallo-hydrolase [Alsobacter sp. SYSU BS001988]